MKLSLSLFAMALANTSHQVRASETGNFLRRMVGLTEEETCEDDLSSCMDELAACHAPTDDTMAGSEVMGDDVGTLEEGHPFFRPATFLSGVNPCDGATPTDDYFNDVDCLVEGVLNTLEQAGTNVTVGYTGEIDTTGREPIMTHYWEAGLCPVNVHWHLGAEHYSAGEYDEFGTGPDYELPADTQMGFRCGLYDETDPKFTTEYDWQFCTQMKVGETYEVHWPHSAAGACGTINQYQTPFKDGVFCMPGIISLDPLNTYYKIGVQGQVFTVINDEDYYYPDLLRGWIVDEPLGFGTEITRYTGSTTGQKVDSNTLCSRYTPVTWQVDRKCHLISASSFDKLCADMMNQQDDMSEDVYPHGSRELVADHLAADNHQNMRY